MSTIIDSQGVMTVNGMDSVVTVSAAAMPTAVQSMRNNVNVINVTMERKTVSTNTTIGGSGGGGHFDAASGGNGSSHAAIVGNSSEPASGDEFALGTRKGSVSGSVNVSLGGKIAAARLATAATTTTATSATTSRISYVRRGNFYGALFDADHLATFSVGSKYGVVRAEDGIRKLRQMEKAQGIWRMECQLMIDARNLVVYDKKTGQAVEAFPIELVCDPTSVVSDDQKDAAYNNIIMFSVLESQRAMRPPPAVAGSANDEMHIFQCAHDVNSADMVDEIYRVKEARMTMMMMNGVVVGGGNGDTAGSDVAVEPPHSGSAMMMMMTRGRQPTQQTNLHSYTVTHVEPTSRTMYRPSNNMPPVPPNHVVSNAYQVHQPQGVENSYRKLVMPAQPDLNNNPMSMMRHQQRGSMVPNSPQIASQSVSNHQHQQYQVNLASKPPAPHQHPSVDYYMPPAPSSMPVVSSSQHAAAINQYQQLSAGRIDMEVQVLNHCFDDIESFVSRLQTTVESVRELEKRYHKHVGASVSKKSSTKSKSTVPKSKKAKLILDEMQATRAQLPQTHSFVDIFQKFKLSFNLLARLRAHIHNPNAPELVHFLFNPLGLIMQAISKEISWLMDAAAETVGSAETKRDELASSVDSGEKGLKGLVKTVWLPMLTRDAKELLLNTLNSKEQELWFTFGDAWMVSREEAKLQPHLYSANLDLSQHYTPVFYDGWTPNVSAVVAPDPYSVSYPSNGQQVTAGDFSRLAYSAANAAHNGVLKYGGGGAAAAAPRSSTDSSSTAHHQQQQKRINFVDESTLSNNTSRPGANRTAMGASRIGGNQNESNASTALNYSTKLPLQINIRNYEEMKKWAVDLAYRGAKVYEVIHDRQANNDKELSIKVGELLEVLDDKRNWWKLRNFYGNTGYAPVTILRPFDLSSVVL